MLLDGVEGGTRFPAREDRTSSRIVFMRWKAPATTGPAESPNQVVPVWKRFTRDSYCVTFLSWKKTGSHIQSRAEVPITLLAK